MNEQWGDTDDEHVLSACERDRHSTGLCAPRALRRHALLLTCSAHEAARGTAFFSFLLHSFSLFLFFSFSKHLSEQTKLYFSTCVLRKEFNIHLLFSRPKLYSLWSNKLTAIVADKRSITAEYSKTTRSCFGGVQLLSIYQFRTFHLYRYAKPLNRL